MDKKEIRALLKYTDFEPKNNVNRFEIIEKVVVVKAGIEEEIESHTVRFNNWEDLNEYLENGE